jgi:hypothetical protein
MFILRPALSGKIYVISNIHSSQNKAFLKTIKPPTSSTFASAEVNEIETENENEMASAYPSAHGPGHPTGPVEVAILS